MEIGSTVTVTLEEAKALRKKGYLPRRDLVTMMYVGLPAPVVQANRSIAGQQSPTKFAPKKEWTAAEHAFANRKIAEASEG